MFIKSKTRSAVVSHSNFHFFVFKETKLQDSEETKVVFNEELPHREENRHTTEILWTTRI